MAGMKGEREHAQLVIDQASQLAVGVDVVFSDLTNEDGGRISSSSYSWFEVGYVNVQKTSRYSPSGGGWMPDPLLPPEKVGILQTQPSAANAVVWLSLDIPRAASAGVYKGTITVGTVSFDVSVTVWGLLLPLPEALHKDFPEIWSFNVPNLQSLYGANVRQTP
jgi:hypothetical protein